VPEFERAVLEGELLGVLPDLVATRSASTWCWSRGAFRARASYEEARGEVAAYLRRRAAERAIGEYVRRLGRRLRASRPANGSFDLDQDAPARRIDDASIWTGARGMYKHILIPTDGSKLSEKAVEAGIEFGALHPCAGDRLHRGSEYQVPSEAELMSKHAISLDDYERDAKKQAEIALQTIADARAPAGVDYDAEFTQSDRPHEAIIRAAEKHGCDLIFMASHGRRGLSALVHGSETQGVLTHSSIPTLVYR